MSTRRTAQLAVVLGDLQEQLVRLFVLAERELLEVLGVGRRVLVRPLARVLAALELRLRRRVLVLRLVLVLAFRAIVVAHLRLHHIRACSNNTSTYTVQYTTSQKVDEKYDYKYEQ